MRRIAIIAMALTPALAGAEAWQRVTSEAEVRAALQDRRVQYDSGAWQEFRASGKTLYNAGQDSWGNWRAQGAQYCSEWPPTGGWACYDLDVTETAVRFVGPGGDITTGVYAETD